MLATLWHSAAALFDESTAAPHPDDAPAEVSAPMSGYATAGYMAAIFVPIFGICLIVPLIVRGEYRHAAGVAVTVVASFIVRVALLSGMVV